MRKNQTPSPPRRIRRATSEFPDVSRLAVKDPRYSLSADNYLIPYAKAPNHPQYKKMALTVGETFYAVNKNNFKVESILTKMPDGLYVAWTTCGKCHSHPRQCKCPNGLTLGRSIEFIYDKTVADLAGEEFAYGHRNYLGSVLPKQQQTKSRLDWVPVSPLTNAASTAPSSPAKAVKEAPRVVTSTPAPKRLRRAPSAPQVPSAPKRLRRVTQEPASKVTTRSGGLDHRAADAAARTNARALTSEVNKMLDGAPRKRIRKAGSK